MCKYENHSVSSGWKMDKSKSYGSVSVYQQLYIIIVMVELLQYINSCKI